MASYDVVAMKLCESENSQSDTAGDALTSSEGTTSASSSSPTLPKTIDFPNENLIDNAFIPPAEADKPELPFRLGPIVASNAWLEMWSVENYPAERSPITWESLLPLRSPVDIRATHWQDSWNQPWDTTRHPSFDIYDSTYF